MKNQTRKIDRGVSREKLVLSTREILSVAAGPSNELQSHTVAYIKETVACDA